GRDLRRRGRPRRAGRGPGPPADRRGARAPRRAGRHDGGPVRRRRQRARAAPLRARGLHAPRGPRPVRAHDPRDRGVGRRPRDACHAPFTNWCHHEPMTDTSTQRTLDPDLAAHIAEHIAEEPEIEQVGAELDLRPLPDDRFADRELSWLAFNQRVLELAEDPSQPLLERVRFLAIFASNLDEFFMVRVAGLKRRMATGIAVTAASGLSPRQVLDAISERAHDLMARHARVFAEDVQPALAAEGITLVHWDELETREQERLHKFFRKQIFPVLTPLAVDPAHPFPYISGLSLNLAVVVANPTTGKEHFARVKVPPLLPRFIAVDARGRPSAPTSQTAAPDRGPTSFVPIEEVIAQHLDHLF